MFLNIIKLWYHGRLKRRLRRTITKIHPLADSEGWAGWVSKPYMEVGSGSVWLNVTVKQLLLIHKQQATNRAAILWGNHWGGRRGGGGCGAQRAGLSNCCNFPFIILIRQLRSQWKPDARGARLPGKKYVPGVHAGSQEPPTSKLRRVNTLPRHKFGKVWGGDTVYFHSFRWVILKAIYLNTCTRKNFIWKPYSGEWNHPVTWIRASQAALVKLFVLAVRIANIQVKPSAPFRFHIVFM